MSADAERHWCQAMDIPDNIYIIGPMGAGKSTVGRHLARALHKRFYDSDREIEERTGADIPLIFELEGEAGFRKRESRMLEVLTGLEGVVLATGGGAVLDPASRSRLVTHGFVVYLSAPLELLLERTTRDRSRPLLETDDPRARLEQILVERDPIYREMADMIITTSHRNPRHVARDIVRRISSL